MGGCCASHVTDASSPAAASIRRDATEARRDASQHQAATMPADLAAPPVPPPHGCDDVDDGDDEAAREWLSSSSDRDNDSATRAVISHYQRHGSPAAAATTWAAPPPHLPHVSAWLDATIGAIVARRVASSVELALEPAAAAPSSSLSALLPTRDRMPAADSASSSPPPSESAMKHESICVTAFAGATTVEREADVRWTDARRHGAAGCVFEDVARSDDHNHDRRTTLPDDLGEATLPDDLGEATSQHSGTCTERAAGTPPHFHLVAGTGVDGDSPRFRHRKEEQPTCLTASAVSLSRALLYTSGV